MCLLMLHQFYRMERSILALLYFAHLYILVHIGICRPPPSTSGRRTDRSDVVSGHTNSSLLFNTTVLSADGGSINSPQLRTKVYLGPHNTSGSNLTNRQTMGERRILTCKSPTGTFHHSHCRHMKGIAYSVREYMTWCREPMPPGAPQPTFTLPSEARAMASSLGREDPSLHGEYGTCHSDEICVDSVYSIDYREGLRMIANCVPKRLFRDAGFLWKDRWDDLDDIHWAEFGNEKLVGGPSSERDEGSIRGERQGDQKHSEELGNQTKIEVSSSELFAGKYASVVITEGEEGITPLEVKAIDLKSLGNTTSQENEVAGSASGYQGAGAFEADPRNSSARWQAPVDPFIVEQERSCTNCVHLKTFKPLASDTTVLEMEVEMISVGSVTLAGILWVALLSG